MIKDKINTKPNSEICLPSKKGRSIQIALTFTKADLGLTIQACYSSYLEG